MNFSGWEIKFYDLIDKLPFDISIYHPYIVHFAISIPFIALILQWSSLLNSEKNFQAASSFLYFLGLILIILAFISGKATTPDIKPTLNVAGQDLFDTHQEMGGYILIGFFILYTLKAISLSVKKEAINYTVTVVTILVMIGLISQMRSGYKLVYDFGAGTQMEYVDH